MNRMIKYVYCKTNIQIHFNEWIIYTKCSLVNIPTYLFNQLIYNKIHDKNSNNIDKTSERCFENDIKV